MERLLNTKQKVVGIKQTTKAVEQGVATSVYIARDAENHVVRSLVALCGEKQQEITYAETMVELGKACGIKIKAAAAAVVI